MGVIAGVGFYQVGADVSVTAFGGLVVTPSEDSVVADVLDDTHAVTVAAGVVKITLPGGG